MIVNLEPETMPKISDEQRDARRTEIMNAALRCFVRSGYQQTSMADIIAESGLSAGAIYSYFSSKQELIRDVAAGVLANRRSELIAAQQDHVLSPAEIITTIAAGFGKDAPIEALIQTWAEATVDPEVRDLVLNALATMRTVIVGALARWAESLPRLPEGWASAEDWAEVSAPVLMSVLPGFALQRAIVPGFDTARFLDALPTLLPGRPVLATRSHAPSLPD
ncbi:MAG: TetR/AcrR family transcriptional regulator [Microthrixaceae bacterium]|nr:TetR/AcrR family transcriptional regulator [Microthrixaceae bacterium]